MGVALYRPDVVAAVGVDFHDPDINLSANINATYIGKSLGPRPDRRLGNTERDEKVDGDGYLEIDGYTLVDASLTQRLTDFGDTGHKLSLNVAVRNIFDKYYESIAYYPGPGRNFYVGLRYEFK